MKLKNGLGALAALTVVGTFGIPAAHAQDAHTAPAFAVQTAADVYIRSGYSAYARGDWKKAVLFSKKSTAKGIKKSRRSIAYANLCAALAQQNKLADALTACEAAVEMGPTNWRALNNRGAVNLLSGNGAAAHADFSAALPLAEGAAQVTHNAALASGAKLARS